MIHERTRSRDTNDSAIVVAAAAAAYNMTLPNDAPKRTRPSDGQTSAAAAAVGSFVRTYIILYPIRCMYTLRTRRSSTLAAFSAIETAARH